LKKKPSRLQFKKKRKKKEQEIPRKATNNKRKLEIGTETTTITTGRRINQQPPHDARDMEH